MEAIVWQGITLVLGGLLGLLASGALVLAIDYLRENAEAVRWLRLVDEITSAVFRAEVADLAAYEEQAKLTGRDARLLYVIDRAKEIAGKLRVNVDIDQIIDIIERAVAEKRE